MSRRELMLWLVAALVANFLVQFVDLRSLDAFAITLAQQNLIFCFACFVVFYRLSESERGQPARWRDITLVTATALLIALSSVIPHKSAIGTVTIAVGLCALLTSPRDRNFRAAAAVLFALSAHLVWAPAFFQFFTPELLKADAALVGGVLQVLRPDIVWNGTTFQTPAGHSVALVAACSSFHNVSGAMLASVAMTMLLRTHWMRRDVLAIAAVGGAMVVMNVARLCVLAWSPDAYQYWHQDEGGKILAFLQTAAIVGLAYWGARPEERRA